MILYHAGTPRGAVLRPPLRGAGGQAYTWDHKSSEQLYACPRRDRALVLGYAETLARWGVTVERVETRGAHAYLHTSGLTYVEVCERAEEIDELQLYTLRPADEWKLANVLHNEYYRRTAVPADEVMALTPVPRRELERRFTLHLLHPSAERDHA